MARTRQSNQELPDPNSPEGRKRRARADSVHSKLMTSVDDLIELGFKKKDIFKMISIHHGRRKAKR